MRTTAPVAFALMFVLAIVVPAHAQDQSQDVQVVPLKAGMVFPLVKPSRAAAATLGERCSDYFTLHVEPETESMPKSETLVFFFLGELPDGRPGIIDFGLPIHLVLPEKVEGLPVPILTILRTEVSSVSPLVKISLSPEELARSTSCLK